MDLNHHDGGSVEGWDEVMQSVLTVLETRLGTRVFRRAFGSEVPSLVDAPMNDAGVLSLYVAVAEALERWEPRFELTNVQASAGANGAITLALIGNYRPNAHLGDFGGAEEEAKSLRVQRDQFENWRIAA